MNALAVILIGYVLHGMGLGLRPTIGLGPRDNKEIFPSLLLPLIVYVALFAPAGPTLWLALGAGLMVDLASPMTIRGPEPFLWLVGPSALGYLVAAYFALTIRGFMIKRNPLALAVLSLLAAALAGVIAVAVITARNQFYAGMDWHPGHQLVVRLGSAVYTGLAALLLSFLFRPLTGAMGLQVSHLRRR